MSTFAWFFATVWWIAGFCVGWGVRAIISKSKDKS